MIALLIGGTIVLCAGLLTVVFGVPIKEFSFGNTMIIAGAVVACTGLLLLGLFVVGRELRALLNRLEAGLPAPSALPREAVPSPVRPRVPEPPKPAPRPAPREDTLFVRDQQPRETAETEEAAAPAWDEPAPPPPPPIPPRSRTLPLSRPAEQTEPPPFAERPRRDFAAEEAPAAEPAAETPPSFEEAWPEPGRRRLDPALLRTPRTSPLPRREPAESGRERLQVPPRRAAEPAPPSPPVTVVKSGVVDSMAYSLYSDGSIEAQMPEGMVRFASIEELRAHLDQRQ